MNDRAKQPQPPTSTRRWPLPAPAAVFVVTMLVVYALGIWVAIWQHLVSNTIYHIQVGHPKPSWKQTFYGFVPDSTLDIPRWLWPLFPQMDLVVAFHRYPQGWIDAPESINTQIAFSFALVMAGVLAGRFVCGRLAVRSMTHTATSAQQRTRRRRATRIAHRRVPMWFWGFTAAVGAASIALLGGAAANWYALIQDHIQMSRGNFAAPKRLLWQNFGALSWYDLPFYALWAFLAPFLMLVLPARSQIRSRAKHHGTRCAHCNYPRPPAHRGTDTLCTECGKPPPPAAHRANTSSHPSHRTRRRITYALSALLLVSVVVFLFTPVAAELWMEHVSGQAHPPRGAPFLNQPPMPTTPP